MDRLVKLLERVMDDSDLRYGKSDVEAIARAIINDGWRPDTPGPTPKPAPKHDGWTEEDDDLAIRCSG